VTPEEIADLVHLRRARDLMDREYAQPLDVPAMARTAAMSPAHFSRKFRAAYGETPYSYLMTAASSAPRPSYASFSSRLTRRA
jgi:transcriptional regulator GlxA family with amidase domain